MRNRGPRTLVFADDHPLVLSGLRSLIDAREDLHWKAALHTGDALKTELTGPSPPDLAVIDIFLSDGNVFRIIEELAHQGRLPPFAILSASRDWTHLQRARTMGARGYLLKEERPETIVESIQRMLNGEYIFPPGVEEPRGAGIPGELVGAYHKLTGREKQTLLYISRGYMNREIAEHLGISVRTVENHKARVAEKLGARSGIHLSTLALQLRGLLEGET